MDRRRDTILANLRLDGEGLEIGPSHQPVAAGLPGVRAKTLDVMDQAGLIAKYAYIGEETSRIQPVDYVWAGERYADLVGEARFDWIIASHVIEHVPDVIGFVNDCAEILAEGGLLSLVIPDKRRTFDYHRPPSGLSALVDAHLEGRRRPSAGAAAEFELYFANFDTAPATPRFNNGIDYAKQMMGAVAAGKYHDIHAWVFTPSSFRLLIEDLHGLGLLKLRECSFEEGPGHEFYMQMSKDGPGPDQDRLAMSARALEELSWAKGSAPVAPALEGRIEQLARERNALQAELEATRRTLSWRLTAPLRALRRAVG